MSIALDRPRKGSQSFLTNTLPQVNLLPPEVRAARGLVHAKRWLAFVLVLVLVIAGLGYVWALFRQGSADTDLADAQAETVVLQAEVAKYAEVPIVVNNVRRGEDARVLGMAPEILWKGYVDAIAAVLPANVSIASFTVTQGSASVAAPIPPDGLAAQGVANISFTSNSSTLPDNAAWLDALNSVPGFYKATFASAMLGEEGGAVSYSVTSTIQVDMSANAGRFLTAEGR